MTPVRVRPARADESAILAGMANDLNDHVGVHGRPFTPDRVLADGFGPQAAFTPLVTELDGAVVGYVFFAMGYNTDVAAGTTRGGGLSLDWGVHPSNAGALEFYRRLGAVGVEVRIMGVNGARLRTLADAAPSR